MSQRKGNKCLPWVALCIEDLGYVSEHNANDVIAHTGYHVPAVSADMSAWLHIILHDSWGDVCNKVLFTESRFDRAVTTANTCNLHICRLCVDPKPAFASPKALSSHLRVTHGFRNHRRMYIGNTSVCTSCKTKFDKKGKFCSRTCPTPGD